jgi:hypothetical protein
LTIGAIGMFGFGLLGRPAEGVTMITAFERLCELHGIRPPAGFERALNRPGVRDSIFAALTPEAAAAAVERGRSLEHDEAVALAVQVAEEILGPGGLAIPDG